MIYAIKIQKNLRICEFYCTFAPDLYPVGAVYETKFYKHMYVFITILIVIAAILLTLLVLVQNSKGGGLAAGFASGNQVMGAPKTADFLEKATWTLIALIVVFSIAAVGFGKGQEEAREDQSVIQVEQSAPAAEVPAAEIPTAEVPAEGAE